MDERYDCLPNFVQETQTTYPEHCGHKLLFIIQFDCQSVRIDITPYDNIAHHKHSVTTFVEKVNQLQATITKNWTSQ